ncbi:alkaline shock response membrane anchor protein AmaP [Mitsuokella sp. WILCCON 0060]|uniref:alkaline shock response membrane anchor protein AmaP n=1 Tax=unclassified Mitsuokella TaxID=2637239 RepID=UPI003F11D4C9
MGIINRFLLFVFSIGTAALSVLMLLLTAKVLPESVWLNEIQYILARPETIAGSVIVLVLSLYLLRTSLHSDAEHTRRSGDFILLQSENGGVEVALPAVRSMAEQTLMGLHGIRMAKVRAMGVRPSRKAPETLRLVLELTVSRHVNVKELTAAAADAVRAQIHEVMGLDDIAVDTKITGITDALPAKRRVV